MSQTLNHQGTAGFSPCFHLPGFYFGGYPIFDPLPFGFPLCGIFSASVAIKRQVGGGGPTAAAAGATPAAAGCGDLTWLSVELSVCLAARLPLGVARWFGFGFEPLAFACFAEGKWEPLLHQEKHKSKPPIGGGS